MDFLKLTFAFGPLLNSNQIFSQDFYLSTPPTIENQTSKGFPVFFKEKTGNWTKLWGGEPPFVKKPNYFPLLFLKSSLNNSLGDPPPAPGGGVDFLTKSA